MRNLSRIAATVRSLIAPHRRESARRRKSAMIRPVVETLESIELLSTMSPRIAAKRPPATVQILGETAGIQSVLPPNYGITGVRQDLNGNVAITGGTGVPSLNDGTPAFIYHGPLDQLSSSSGTDSGYLHLFTPTFAGETVTGSQFYGPNTALFDPSIGEGNIRAVGAYRYTGSSFQAGMIYTGPLDNSGTYTKIVAPGDGSGPVGDTIPHSTMGDLVVGNFDYQSDQARGHGFIYHRSTGTYQTIDIGRYSTTLYGVWQNGGPTSNQYTIVGGYSGNARGGKAFIANYNADTHTMSRIQTYTFNNKPSIVTHFEGISAIPGGFSIAATQLSRKDFGASYAFIPVKKNGAFGKARWVAMKNTVNQGPTTGDTVIDRTVMGIFPTSSTVASSFVSTVKLK